MLKLAGFFWLFFTPALWADEGPAASAHLGELVATDTVQDPKLRSILETAQADHQAWTMLADLCDGVGARLAGSEALERAVTWAVAQLETVGSDNTWTEEVAIPSWERGDETASMLTPRQYTMSILGLGGTVAGEVEGDVVVVEALDDVGPEVAGKIVLFNIPMKDGVPTVAEYGAAVQTRLFGPSRAGQHGAIAAMVRPYPADKSGT